MRRLSILSLLSILCIFVVSGSSFAQTAETDAVMGRQAAIQDISMGLEGGGLNFVSARDQLRLLRSEARQASERLQRQRAEAQEQLEALGPGPQQGDVEPEDVAKRRATLLAQSVAASALLAQANLNADDANRLLAGLSGLQRDAFFDETLKPSTSALRPKLWTDSAESFHHLTAVVNSHLRAWHKRRSEAGALVIDLAKLGGVLAFAIMLFWPVRRWINAAFATSLVNRKPTEFQKYGAMVARILTRLVPGIIGGFAILSVLNSTGLVSVSGQPFAKSVWYVVLLYLVADGMALGLFAPKLSDWRIIPLQDDPAGRAKWLSVSAVTIVGMSYALCTAAFIDAGSRNFANGVIVVEACLISALLFLTVMPSGWQLKTDIEDAFSPAAAKRWAYLRRFSIPLALGIIGALLIGYLNLAAFLSSRSVVFVGLIVWIWIGRRGVMTALRAFDASFMETRMEAGAAGRQAMLFWSGLVVDFIILLTAAPLIALLFGVDPYTVRTGFVDIFTGIQIGNFTFSLANVFAGIVTFFVVFLVTRLLQRGLDARLFTGNRADQGFRNSFRTLLGYAGLVVAIFAAIGVMGLDLSNLAIIAGALSVGIGFGLQSIVNNFVSGLILLFERPVKVGDWVVTSSGEGTVKKISVRSTEIITFDRASVIVPNSELISNSVKNWTHKDKGGRVTVPVGVAYGTNVRKVREMLLQVAADNEQILQEPAPFVYFKEFGDSSLDLELRFFIRNISDNPVIRNDIRFAILDVFQDNDIEIPFPQRDLHIQKEP